MSASAFDDAQAALSAGLPVPRGIAFRITSDDAIGPIQERLRGWSIQPVAGLPGWHEAIRPVEAPPETAPGDLAAVWAHVRFIQGLDHVTAAEPLLLIANPEAPTDKAAEAFAMTLGAGPMALWGWRYDDQTKQAINDGRLQHNWHLTQLNVPAAHERWIEAFPGRVPGDGIVVGHPDTGFTDHPGITGRWAGKGRSFIAGDGGPPIPDALDDLTELGVLEQPGHGTATASVIAGDDGVRYVHGVAPGARVLPLRVSRSVIHFDFRNVGRAILHATAEGAHVISMSLGGPLSSVFVRDCIKHAHEQGVIVVSAAGNKIPTVVFPAAYPEVIGVAATHPGREPWRFSGLGEVVDIAAPGEEVWVARAKRGEGAPKYHQHYGTGTSFATACVAGLAALWLSFRGGTAEIARHYGGERALVPFAFQCLLAATADVTPKFAAGGKHGAGIANAEALLAADLPSLDEIRRYRERIEGQSVHRASFLTRLASGILGVTDDAAEGAADSAPAAAEAELLGRLLKDDAQALGDELLARLAADRVLSTAAQRWQTGGSLLPIVGRLLGGAGRRGFAVPPPAETLSPELRARLETTRADEEHALRAIHTGRLTTAPAADRRLAPAQPGDAGPPSLRPPACRNLRAYSFDPSLATQLTTATIFQVTIPVRWEVLQPGPIGEYLEVVDIDPPSECVYAPVDLDHPWALAQEGLPPSEGNPQFHQQMVYAVAMNTIQRFELALGRPIFWAPLRPWLNEDERDIFPGETMQNGGVARSDGLRDRYVQRLRIYPHALREANAYYSPDKRALLFGYFPGGEDAQEGLFPGGMVFSCLSHDIVAHETTHALLDGMHQYFNESSNPDVPAFHEAFADIIALFQHFTYEDVLRHQITGTRGNLETDNLLAQLAQQLGQATGRRGALRNALGEFDDQNTWQRRKPDPLALQGVSEPHDRGSILVAAVFDAFLALYNARVADLIRIATSGTGELPTGQLHPDLTNRLAHEAAETAAEVLRICIRAMDYVPPVDITFGEFLRALITADYELAPTERRATRIAFIEAFRSWGIYPRDVQTLSEESLLWRPPELNPALRQLQDLLGRAAGQPGREAMPEDLEAMGSQLDIQPLVAALQAWEPGGDRREIFAHVTQAQSVVHDLLQALQKHHPDEEVLPGLDLRRQYRSRKGFSVGNLRPARRIGQQGEFHLEMVVEVVQAYGGEDGEADDAVPFRGGATLIVDMRTGTIRYVIYKRLYAGQPVAGKPRVPTDRLRRQLRDQGRLDLRAGAAGMGVGPASEWLDATVGCQERKRKRRKREPFAALHRAAT